MGVAIDVGEGLTSCCVAVILSAILPIVVGNWTARGNCIPSEALDVEVLASDSLLL